MINSTKTKNNLLQWRVCVCVRALAVFIDPPAVYGAFYDLISELVKSLSGSPADLDLLHRLGLCRRSNFSVGIFPH